MVEYCMILTISYTFAFSYNILIQQGFTERLDLLFQTILSNHQGEVGCILRFLILTCQQMEDNPGTEADNGCTFAVGVFYMVDVLRSLHTLRLSKNFF